MKKFLKMSLMALTAMFMVACGGGGGDDGGDTYDTLNVTTASGETIDLGQVASQVEVIIIKNVNQAEADLVKQMVEQAYEPYPVVVQADVSCSQLGNYQLIENDVLMDQGNVQPGVIANSWYRYRSDYSNPHFWCKEYNYIDGSTVFGQEASGDLTVIIGGYKHEQTDVVDHLWHYFDPPNYDGSN